MLTGILDLPWWGYIVVTLVLTHLTIASVTIYLHRHMAHRALELHPAVAHVFRFWLWLSTGMTTIQWVAVHRKHHAFVETKDDPHSPQVAGIKKLILDGVDLYRIEAVNQETMEKYGHGCPEDWLERNVYAPQSGRGYFLMLAINLVLFGPIGLTIWAVQMIWIPFFAAGLVNGLGHWWGYRKFETADTSTNIAPWGIIIGGEELHNNHHAFASSAKFSCQPWEFDIGWVYIRFLAALGLARVKKVAPKPVLNRDKVEADHETVRAIISNRFQVMAQYAKKVLHEVHAEELRRADARNRGLLKSARKLLAKEEALLSEDSRNHLEIILANSPSLAVVYDHKRRLSALWEERTATRDSLVVSLQQWCREAEESGIRALQEFARTLHWYSEEPSHA